MPGDTCAIHDYIAEDSAQYANRTIDRITRKSKCLARHPLSGHAVPEYEDQAGPDIRQILQGSYRIIYRVRPDVVQVLAVIHSARHMPPVDSLE